MPQNLISIEISDTERQQATELVTQLKALLEPKTLGLDADQRQGLLKMGDKSEAFCRATLTALAENRQVVPASLGLEEALADQRALDALRPLLLQLSQLTERLRDTETALGSDVMNAAVEGYALLKVTGRNQGLDGLVRELGSRFARRRRKPIGPADPAAPTDDEALASGD
ncbi:hypothetical protein H4F99_00075 [Lysobacter sp. SG-8]|uniref:Uncharacterized protein n=1 Tax=Marilutibacter penaei TaxID=2759900 RepID=A0A7W3U0W5_9GAMM|nr:hypothetical protein [Lysobacter penaei]MBB1086877.1 hypothetical protein [Lysobacter penaei]